MSYDLLIKNGLLVDGTGAPAWRADIAVAADRIAEIGRIGDGAAHRRFRPSRRSGLHRSAQR